MFPFRILSGLTLGLLAAACLCDRASAESQERAAEEEAAIRTATAKFVSAFNAADFKAMAGLWKDDGLYVDDMGRAVNVRERWKHASESGQPAASRSLTISVETVRLITPDVAVADGLSSLKLGAGKTRHGRYTAVWVKQKGTWLIDSIRESQLSSSSHHARLLELDWLVGKWSAEDKNNTARMTVSWSPDQNFLIREIALHAADGSEHSATQRIGWDPLKAEFKSWLFDSTGGYFEGSWENDDGTWVIDSLGVSADGKIVKSKGRCTRVDENTILWESTEATIDGEPQPDIEARLVRQPGA